MENFTPIPATLGGLLIGIASTMLLVGLGRIAGISGILGQLFGPDADGRGWRIAFLVGLIGAPAIWLMVSGDSVPVIDASLPLLIIGGLLVGFGTRLGGGCTSGHGICGLGRLSLRSLVATLVFMAVAVITVFIMRHVVGG